MSEPPLTLDRHLDACAAETHLRIGADTAGPACAAFRAALADDPAMDLAARQAIQDGAPLESRDHITRWRCGLLRQALEV